MKRAVGVLLLGVAVAGLVLMLLALAAVPLAAQTIKVSGQSRLDSTMTATGKVVPSATAKKSRVKWTACLQIDTTSAAWKCSTQTGPWVVVVPPIDTTLLLHARGLELKPDTLRVLAGVAEQACAFLRFRNGVIPANLSAPAACLSGYGAWFTPAERAVSPAQRARADSVYGGVLLLSGMTKPWGQVLAALGAAQ